MSSGNSEAVILRGLDGANPLAFLAALGTLRVLTRGTSDLRPRMAWQIHEGAWRPRLCLGVPLDEDEIAERVTNACARLRSESALTFADNVAVSPETYRAFVVEAAQSALRGDGVQAEFAACFACEALLNENKAVQDTAFRTMSGAGHQHFLRTMRNLVAQTGKQHVLETLFSRWRYEDPVRNMSLRWDPSDDSRYALRWSDPSGDPKRQSSGAMWGANRLALEALPLAPVMPTMRRLETTGFRTSGSRRIFWTWPIWETAIELETIRSLLALDDQQSDMPNRSNLRARGVVEIFRSQRLTVGKFRNFTWGVPA